jgi:hypothetical protein
MELNNAYQEKLKARLKEWNAGRDHSESDAGAYAAHAKFNFRKEAQALRAKYEAQAKLKDHRDAGEEGRLRAPPTGSGSEHFAPAERVSDWRALYQQERESNTRLRARIAELETANHELRNRLYIAMMELEDSRGDRAAQQK